MSEHAVAVCREGDWLLVAETQAERCQSAEELSPLASRTVYCRLGPDSKRMRAGSHRGEARFVAARSVPAVGPQVEEDVGKRSLPKRCSRFGSQKETSLARRREDRERQSQAASAVGPTEPL